MSKNINALRDSDYMPRRRNELEREYHEEANRCRCKVPIGGRVYAGVEHCAACGGAIRGE